MNKKDIAALVFILVQSDMFVNVISHIKCHCDSWFDGFFPENNCHVEIRELTQDLRSDIVKELAQLAGQRRFAGCPGGDGRVNAVGFLYVKARRTTAVVLLGQRRSHLGIHRSHPGSTLCSGCSRRVLDTVLLEASGTADQQFEDRPREKKPRQLRGTSKN